MLSKLLSPCDVLWPRTRFKKEIGFWSFWTNANVFLSSLIILFQFIELAGTKVFRQVHTLGLPFLSLNSEGSRPCDSAPRILWHTNSLIPISSHGKANCRIQVDINIHRFRFLTWMNMWMHPFSSSFYRK